jgi:FKBP-type peptidyl-prolyl cis-trans isomerase FklB
MQQGNRKEHKGSPPGGPFAHLPPLVDPSDESHTARSRKDVMRTDFTARLAPALVALLLSSAAMAADEAALDFNDEATRVNYSLGYQIGGDFKRQGVTMNAEAVVQGIRDALEGGSPAMQPDEMHATLVALKRQVVEEQRAHRQEMELERLREGDEFLAENAGREGVITTGSGLQYRIIDPGSGRVPAASDRVTVTYRGTLVSGKQIDQAENASFRLNDVIPGWTEGLQLIGEGGRIELFLPPRLAFKDRGPLAHRTLIFELELRSVEPSPATNAG